MLQQLNAQQNHYIYIQSENSQAFFIRTKDKVYSASEAGYVIVPSLPEGMFDFVIGFPKNMSRPIAYQIEIKQKDIGFELKKENDSTWSLYELQNNQRVEGKIYQKSPGYNIENNTDEFSLLLADVSNTPSIKTRRIKPAPEQTNDSTLLVSNKSMEPNASPAVDSMQSTQAVEKEIQQAVIPEIIPEAKTIAIAEPALPLEVVKKDFDYLDSTGRSLVYTITLGETTEKVVIFLPYTEKGTKKKSKAKPQNEVPKVEKAIVEVAEKSKEEIAALKQCAKQAEGKDFFQLRKKMVDQIDETKMIEVALAVFKSKCFSVEQIKNLAVIILNEKNRFLFLEMAYPYTSNKDAFSNLQMLLTEAEHINSFKALLKQ